MKLEKLRFAWQTESLIDKSCLWRIDQTGSFDENSFSLSSNVLRRCSSRAFARKIFYGELMTEQQTRDYT